MGDDVFQPIAGLKWRPSLDEADMAAGGRHQKSDRGRKRLLPGENFFGHERIISGVQDEGGFANAFEVAAAAGFLIIVFGILKSVERGNDLVVVSPEGSEVTQGAKLPEPIEVMMVPQRCKGLHLLVEIVVQFFQQLVSIKAGEAAIEATGTCVESHRHRTGQRTIEMACRSGFTQMFQKNIAPERESRCKKRLVRCALAETVDDPCKVTGFA